MSQNYGQSPQGQAIQRGDQGIRIREYNFDFFFEFQFQLFFSLLPPNRNKITCNNTISSSLSPGSNFSIVTIFCPNVWFLRFNKRMILLQNSLPQFLGKKLPLDFHLTSYKRYSKRSPQGKTKRPSTPFTNNIHCPTPDPDSPHT